METPSARPNLYAAASFTLLFSLFLFCVPLPTHSQSGRQKDPKIKNTNKSNRSSSPIADPSNANADEVEEVLRVSSNLVPVPTTVVNNSGVAITNLKLEDFELRVDGQLGTITDISRSETPVRMAMLFDNSGSLSESREFEKRAAIKFFQNVMRPMDEAAIYSISTNVELAQQMTGDIQRLERTIDSFPKPEGATSLYDGVFAALAYLRPHNGRRVI